MIVVENMFKQINAEWKAKGNRKFHGRRRPPPHISVISCSADAKDKVIDEAEIEPLCVCVCVRERERERKREREKERETIL